MNVLLGIWLLFAPWVLQFAGVAAANSVVLGFLVLVVAAGSLSVRPINYVWGWINMLLGIWVFISPWVLGFSVLPNAFWNSLAVGAAIVVFALARMAASRRITGAPV
jgi:hypothetical protein